MLAVLALERHSRRSKRYHQTSRRYRELPGYRLLDEKGPDHAKCFEVCAEVDGRRFPSAWAPSKKQAEQAAALLALRELGLVRSDTDGHIELVEEVE